ncbi:unnamed protein product [Scytosiphon promiscuus]
MVDPSVSDSAGSQRISTPPRCVDPTPTTIRFVFHMMMDVIHAAWLPSSSIGTKRGTKGSLHRDFCLYRVLFVSKHRRRFPLVSVDRPHASGKSCDAKGSNSKMKGLAALFRDARNSLVS